MAAALDLRGIHKRYGSLSVLKDLSLQCEAGQFYALVGRNGSGKSTLMRVAMRLEPPDSGEGETLGRSILRDCPEVNRQAAYVSEQMIYPSYGSLRSFFEYYPKIVRGWDLKRFLEILSPIGFDLDKKFANLSRGQRMQVSFAAALATRPKLLLLDEITAVLDARVRAYFLGMLSELVRDGGCVVLATNIVSEVQSYAERMLFLNQGRIEIDSRFKDIAQKFVKLRKPTGTEHSVFQAESCVAVGVDDDGALLFLLPIGDSGAHSITQELRSERAIRTEEVFVYLTTRERSVA